MWKCGELFKGPPPPLSTDPPYKAFKEMNKSMQDSGLSMIFFRGFEERKQHTSKAKYSKFISFVSPMVPFCIKYKINIFEIQ